MPCTPPASEYSARSSDSGRHPDAPAASPSAPSQDASSADGSRAVAPGTSHRPPSSQQVANLHATLPHRRTRPSSLTPIRSLQKVHPRRAILAIALQLMLHVRRRSPNRVPPKQLHRAPALLAPKLRVLIHQRLGQLLHLPERLVPTRSPHPATLHFTLVKLLALCCCQDCTSKPAR